MTEAVEKILSWYESDNPGVKTNLARLLYHGKLGGTGKLIILPVDQGFEHGPDRCFVVNPPAYDPTRCAQCGVVIVLSEGGYSSVGDQHYCEKCTAARMGDLFAPARRRGRQGKVRGPQPRPRGGVRSRSTRRRSSGR